MEVEEEEDWPLALLLEEAAKEVDDDALCGNSRCSMAPCICELEGSVSSSSGPTSQLAYAGFLGDL